MANKSQTQIGGVDASINAAVTWTRVLPEQPTRGALLFANNSANAMGVYFAPIGNNNTTPALTISSPGVYPLLANASYEPDGGFIFTNELWVIAAAGPSPFTCTFAAQ